MNTILKASIVQVTHFLNPNEDILYFNERFAKNEFQVMFSELDSEISKEDILTAIKHLKSGKSSGPDHMLNEFFIYGKNEMFKLCICYFQ